MYVTWDDLDVNLKMAIGLVDRLEESIAHIDQLSRRHNTRSRLMRQAESLSAVCGFVSHLINRAMDHMPSARIAFALVEFLHPLVEKAMSLEQALQRVPPDGKI